ncbi:SDR family NAD(P)-dependent oxidoreductase [Allosediminivita pacifica]|uniref:NADP-dependent 3-hydroxy acid dehydrogenase YdfG n=1 Tax=Allosediminivita pacifica TaxID=1267769 RepID=A0A2T6AD64_9RHOB|nr:SDR family NAD(P)-dependent oxidoreductase [Allosediminivita pacifica]PTX41760.1 NADP-dependent 3-hydroxy acid dehydrogenase YdfG [Allosediminivita pacifica]GGB22741.1 short-chain dehydrogenase [Allosediminivita pacifica]
MSRPVVMVSGASRGIGAAIAAEMLDAGWDLSLGLRDPSCCPLAISERVMACHFDATDAQSEREWVSATQARFGRLDGLVLNAGVLSRSSVLDASEAEFDELFGINVKSPMRLAQAAWPMLEQGPGRIVTIASLSGKRVKSAGAGLYAMSKFAVVGLTHALRQAGRDSGVRATAICPSFVATDMGRRASGTDGSGKTRPEDIARITRTVLELPSSASVAEIPVHWDVEDCF